MQDALNNSEASLLNQRRAMNQLESAERALTAEQQKAATRAEELALAVEREPRRSSNPSLSAISDASRASPNHLRGLVSAIRKQASPSRARSRRAR